MGPAWFFLTLWYRIFVLADVSPNVIMMELLTGSPFLIIIQAVAIRRKSFSKYFLLQSLLLLYQCFVASMSYMLQIKSSFRINWCTSSHSNATSSNNTNESSIPFDYSLLSIVIIMLSSLMSLCGNKEVYAATMMYSIHHHHPSSSFKQCFEF